MAYTNYLLNAVIGFSLILGGCATTAAVMEKDTEVVIEFKKNGKVKLKDKEQRELEKCDAPGTSPCKPVKELLEEYNIEVKRYLTNPTCVYTYTIGGVTYQYYYQC